MHRVALCTSSEVKPSQLLEAVLCSKQFIWYNMPVLLYCCENDGTENDLRCPTFSRTTLVFFYLFILFNSIDFLILLTLNDSVQPSIYQMI